ncbi:MAG: MBOAT family protein [Leptospiraceae bacterium]|nr:MBOAT family protein [Leptospiraceae bacterium]MCP5502985.1 MBOAT family protein [Leptospiraceae bacterium]
MLFNSIPFLVLFFFTFLLYWNIPDKYKKHLLIISSVLFYSYFSLLSTLHFLLVIAINFYFSEKLFSLKEKQEDTKKVLRVIVILNILNLCFFKYYYFFMDSFYFISRAELFKQGAYALQILLPLAISFYTFQLVALQIDIHRDKIEKRLSASDYFLFILFFPQLIAGPIMRTTDFFPQLGKYSISPESMKRGILLLLGGLLKKVVISDNLGIIIVPLYKNPSAYDSFSLFMGVFAFVSQVYCDFSGYTDMARGLAYLLGFSIPENFRGPFLAKSFREIWGRWHVTLSTWLRDYLYIPLGGSRLGEFRTNLNMLITMSMGGLWHGADISFFFWGFYLGVCLWIERILFKHNIRIPSEAWPVNFLRHIVIFTLFSMSGIFFRAGMEIGIHSERSSLAIALSYFKGMLSFQSGQRLFRLEEIYLYVFLALGFNFIQYKETFSEKIENLAFKAIPAFSLLVLLLLGIFGDGGGDFIYFQF